MVSKAKDRRNPHSFAVSISGKDIIGSVRVNIEFWKAASAAISPVHAVIAPIRIARGPGAGMQTFVPTADLPEIFADKVFALGARPYLKPRDVFDLHWLHVQGGFRECSPDDIQIRLDTYPLETPADWIEKAVSRLTTLSHAEDEILADLRRWLPASWPLDSSAVADMARTAGMALERGIEVMRGIDAGIDDDAEAGPR
ncbi:MAG: hypothetical protein AMXMBFR76_21590 [Pseudomonadota bacterium]